MRTAAFSFFSGLLFSVFLGYAHGFARPEELSSSDDDRLFHFVTV